MSRNIFYKVCGQCMTQVPFDATECGCGHSFAHDQKQLSRTAEVIRAESEEQVYETYLEARLQQTMTTLREVREASGPGNWTREQLGKIQRALQAVHTAKKELEAQRLKTLHASEAAASVRADRAQRQTQAGRAPADQRAQPAIDGFAATPAAEFRAVQANRAQHLFPANQQEVMPVDAPLAMKVGAIVPTSS